MEWEEFITQVKPLSKKQKKQVESQKQQEKFSPTYTQFSPVFFENNATTSRSDTQRKIQRKSGKLPTLDLHGESLESAFNKVEDFIESCFHRAFLEVIIITGKARRTENQHHTIENSLPKWLGTKSMANKISAFQKAPPHLGGNGAMIITLKNPRKARKIYSS